MHRKGFIQSVLSQLFRSKKRAVVTLLILAVIAYFGSRLLGSGASQPSYQTAQAQKGTLISTVSESGQVVVSNRVSITTAASGIINTVYVKNGDAVTTGEKIADITLDNSGQQRQSQAWVSYLSAENSLNNANTQLYTLQSTLFTDWKTFEDLATNSTYQNADGSPNTGNRTLPEFIEAQDAWLAAEANYQNQQNVISQDRVAVSNAGYTYQLDSANVTAPTGGIISDLVIAPGMQIGSQNTASVSTTSTSTQTVASIKSEGTPIITVNLSEVDAAKVKAGNKATVTFDALPDKTFTGNVSGINTTGSVSSGVTNYPATIVLDTPNDSILPNMSATAVIITNIKNNVLMVPIGAVQTTGTQSTVQVLKNGQITPVQVTIGESSDTDTEITSGLSEGDTVIIGYVSTTSSSAGTSPFSRSIFGGFGGGGNRTFIRTRGGG